MSEPPKGLLKSLVEARKKFTPVAKGNTANAGSYKYSYASLEDIMLMIDGPLLENGLVLTHTTDDAHCITRLYHAESGESIECALPIRGGNPQALGSELSYMRRYGVSALLAIVTEEDDDGQRAQDHAKSRPAPARSNARSSGGDDDTARAIKALWAQVRATGKRLDLDNAAQESMLREKISEYGVESTKSLDADQLTAIRKHFKAMEDAF